MLSRNREIKQLIVMENRNNFGFLRKLRPKSCISRIVPLDRVPVLLKKGLEKNKGEGSHYRYLKNPRYCLAAKIETGILYEPDFHKDAQEFACTFGMKMLI